MRVVYYEKKCIFTTRFIIFKLMKTLIRLLFLASILSLSACEKDEQVDVESFVEQVKKGALRSDRVDIVYRDGSIECDVVVEGGSLFYPMMFFSDGTCREFVQPTYRPFMPMLYFEYDWEIVGNSIVSGDERLTIRSFKDGRFVMEGIQFGRGEDAEVDHYVIYGYIETDPELLERYRSCEEFYQFKEAHPELWE